MNKCNKENKNHIGFQMCILSNMLHREFENSEVLQKEKRKAWPDNWLIPYLYDNIDTLVCQKDIEKKFSMKRAAVSKAVSRLEKSGLVVREKVDGDARLNSIKLTEKGIASESEVRKAIDDIEKKFISCLSEQEINELFNLFEKLKTSNCKDKKNCI